MATPSKPTELIVLEGKSHRTKKEIEHREKMEQAVYTGQLFKESAEVRADPVAHKEFTRLKRLYSHIQFVDGLDESVINRYCLELSNLKGMDDRRERLDKMADEAKEDKDRLRAFEMLSRLDAAESRCKDLLLKYEDRLFLNPTSRLKAIPKKPIEKEEKTGMGAFLAKRG